MMNIVKLEEICNIKSGGTPSRSHNEYWKNGKIPWVKISDIKGKYLFETDECITQEGLNNSSAKLFSKGTILYTIFATLGEVCFLDIDASTNQAIAGLEIISDTVYPEYLYYYLVSKKESVKNIGRGVAQNNINLKILKTMDVPLPCIEKQKIISVRLDSIGKLIEFRKKQLSKLDELVKARFVEMVGDLKENSNNYNVVPFEKVIEYIGDIGSNGANKVVVEHLNMKNEEDYALMVRFLNFTKNDFEDDVKFISKESYEFFSKSKIFGGELIICKIGSAGQNYVMPYLNRPVSLGLNQILVRVNNKIIMTYLYQYLHTDYGEFLISNCINGAVTKTITKTKLKKIPIILPPIQLQNEFGEFAEQVEKSKKDIQQSLEKLETLKKSLMQEYFG